MSFKSQKPENPDAARGANLPGKSCELRVRAKSRITSLIIAQLPKRMTNRMDQNKNYGTGRIFLEAWRKNTIIRLLY
jgi:hypothetical protein